jgi:hypothetical protein
MVDAFASGLLILVSALGAPVGGVTHPPRPAPTFPPRAPVSPPSVVPTAPPPPPTGGLDAGQDPLGRKLRIEPERLRELTDDESTDKDGEPLVVRGVLGERLELELEKAAAAAFEFDAVAKTRFEFVARVEGGRARASVRLIGPDGGLRDSIDVGPGAAARLDRVVASTTGTYRLELRPQPGLGSGRLVVTTRGIVEPTELDPATLRDGKPLTIPFGGMEGRTLRSVVLRVPRDAVPPRPFVDVISPSGVATRLPARVADGDPTRVLVDAVPVDELGDWTLRLADFSRIERVGELTLRFDEPRPSRKVVTFEVR